MEARRVFPLVLGLATVVTCLFGSTASAQLGNRQEHVAHSQNFIVFASTPQFAAQVAQSAESFRRELAIYWLGEEIPAWSQRCPIHVQSSPRLGAGGETRFSLMPGGVGNWMMSVQGTEQRVLDSVLPHEITHTIFATHFAHFNKYVPRWADEGACTTVEHVEEKSKHQHFLQEFLRTGRGIAFNKMFTLKDYPKDILPLYAQGHSVVQFLLDQGGPRKFVSFLEDGMRSDDWEAAMQKNYAYQTIGQLQQLWNKWLRDGSPADLAAYGASLQNGQSEAAVSLASSSKDITQPSPANTRLAAVNRTIPRTDAKANAASDPLRGLEGASFASGPSWYRNRLHAVSSSDAGVEQQSKDSAFDVAQSPRASGQDLRAVQPATQPATRETTDNYPLQAYQASRQTAAVPQRNSIQVLDWGNSAPV